MEESNGGDKGCVVVRVWGFVYVGACMAWGGGVGRALMNTHRMKQNKAHRHCRRCGRDARLRQSVAPQRRPLLANMNPTHNRISHPLGIHTQSRDASFVRDTKPSTTPPLKRPNPWPITTQTVMSTAADSPSSNRTLRDPSRRVTKHSAPLGWRDHTCEELPQREKDSYLSVFGGLDLSLHRFPL